MNEKRELKGRPPKLKPQTNCVMVRFDDEEYAKFLSMYEKTRLTSRSAFTKARVFGEEFRVVSTSNPYSEYYTKLSDLHAQYRRIGVNYNQVTKELKFHFSQKKAMALLYRLEQCTKELIAVTNQVVALTQKYEKIWLQR